MIYFYILSNSIFNKLNHYLHILGLSFQKRIQKNPKKFYRPKVNLKFFLQEKSSRFSAHIRLRIKWYANNSGTLVTVSSRKINKTAYERRACIQRSQIQSLSRELFAGRRPLGPFLKSPPVSYGYSKSVYFSEVSHARYRWLRP